MQRNGNHRFAGFPTKNQDHAAILNVTIISRLSVAQSVNFARNVWRINKQWIKHFPSLPQVDKSFDVLRAGIEKPTGTCKLIIDNCPRLRGDDNVNDYCFQIRVNLRNLWLKSIDILQSGVRCLLFVDLECAKKSCIALPENLVAPY